MMIRVGEILPSPSTAAPLGRVEALSLLHLRFAYGVEGDADLPSIWEELARVKGHMKGLATLNQIIKPMLYSILGSKSVRGIHAHCTFLPNRRSLAR